MAFLVTYLYKVHGNLLRSILSINFLNCNRPSPFDPKVYYKFNV